MVPLTYLVRFDAKTGKFIAKSLDFPLVTGEGDSVTAAVEDVKSKLVKMQTEKHEEKIASKKLISSVPLRNQ